MAWYDPTDWDVGDWATVATGPIGWGYSAVTGSGPVGEGIRAGADAVGIGGVFSSPTVSLYNPNFQNFQYGQRTPATWVTLPRVS